MKAVGHKTQVPGHGGLPGYVGLLGRNGLCRGVKRDEED